jgi:uncharacterized membrane protein (GlpM family)
MSLWLALLLRASVSASVVVVATVAAEASGPFWGGLIVSLPIGAGPAYAMLSLQHNASFIAASALGSFAINAATFVFLTTLALLVTRFRWFWALGCALIAWAIAVTLIRNVQWDVAEASLLNLAVVVIALALTRGAGTDAGSRRTSAPRRWFELPVRALMVGMMVGGVVTGSRALGPQLTGMATVFPVAFTSFALLVLPRVDGATGAAIMVSAIRAMPGFAVCLLTLHLAAEPLGVWPALAVALLPSLAWSAMLLWARKKALSFGRLRRTPSPS